MITRHFRLAVLYVAFIFLISSLIVSCDQETRCDTAGFTDPEIQLLGQEGTIIQAQMDSIITFEFALSAEAGLNTFAINGGYNFEPIMAYTRGETEAEVSVERYVWGDLELNFELYDRCGASANLEISIRALDQMR